MTFDAWLQERMRERDLSQADLARATGRSTNIVSLWYRGIKQPGVRSVPRLSLALGVAEAEVLRALNGEVGGGEEGDLVTALKRRIPEVPLSGGEVRLLCDLVEAFVWTIHRWGRHEAYLEAEATRLREEGTAEEKGTALEADPLRTIESNGGGDQLRARRAG